MNYGFAHNFRGIIKKFRSSLFKGLRVWAAPIKSSDITIYQAAVCVLKLSLLKQATAIINRNAKNIVNALR